MMKEYFLKDLVKIKNGKDHKTISDGIIPIYGSGGIMRYGNQFLYDKPSILLPRKGTLDNIQFSKIPFWTVDTIYYTEINEDATKPYFLYNYLKILNLENLNTGTGVPSMTFDSYYNLKIQLPNLSIQKKIANILMDIDNKIDLNNQLNDNLERMAKTLYDYWFVQFDFPDENGKPYKSSGGKMVFNEILKREIPIGWEVEKLGKVLLTYLGGTPSTEKKDYWNGDIPWMNSGEVANFPLLSTEQKITKEAIVNSSTRFLPKGSVILSITRHLRVNILCIDACINQSIAGIKENEKFKNSYIYFSVLNDIERLMTLRTGAQQPHINKQIVDNSNFVLPLDQVLSKYYTVAKPIIEKIFNNSIQNQQLSNLRDWLLPMLMNGQVKVE